MMRCTLAGWRPNPVIPLQLALCLAWAAGPAFGNDDANRSACDEQGELSVLCEYSAPTLRSGHDAMQPVTRWLTPYLDWKKRLAAETGLNYVIEYAPLAQWDLRGDADHTAGAESNFILQWAPINPAGSRRGGLTAWYQHSNTWSSQNTSEFMERLGVLSPLNGGVTGENVSSTNFLQHFAWEQWSADERMRLVVGKLTTRVLLNLNRYAVSDREDFFSPMFVNNPVVPYTARLGFGVYGQLVREEWSVSGMVRQASGTSQWLDFGGIHTDELEYVAEYAFTPDRFLGMGAGNYRITPSYTDGFGEGESRQPSGWTLSFSFDQDLNDRWSAFFRHAHADQPFRAFRRRTSLGAQLRSPLGFEHDRIGMGIWWGEPTDASLGSETGVEVFWKAQVAPFLEVSADLQVVFDPVLNNSQSAWMGGLRLRLVL